MYTQLQSDQQFALLCWFAGRSFAEPIHRSVSEPFLQKKLFSSKSLSIRIRGEPFE